MSEHVLDQERLRCEALGDTLVDVYHGTAGRFEKGIRETGLITKNWHGTVCVTSNLCRALGYATEWAAHYADQGDDPEALVVRILVPARALFPFQPHRSEYELEALARLGERPEAVVDCYMTDPVSPDAIADLHSFRLQPLTDQLTRRSVLLTSCLHASAEARDCGLVDLKSEVTCDRCSFEWVFDERRGWINDRREWVCRDCMTDEEFMPYQVMVSGLYEAMVDELAGRCSAQSDLDRAVAAVADALRARWNLEAPALEEVR